MLMGHVSRFSGADKARALKLLSEIGLSAAAREMGCSHTAIRNWAAEAGVSTRPEEVHKGQIAATQVAAIKRRRINEESRAEMTSLLAEIQREAALAELRMIRSGEASLAELVGARTRALHDQRLIEDKATENVAVAHSVAEIATLREQLRERLQVVS